MYDDEIQLILDDAHEHMDKTLDHLRIELNTIRAGRATPSMLDTVRVEAYGSTMPLNQVSSVSAPQADLIVIQPWDKSMFHPIEKAIQEANLGLNPSNDGSFIRIPVPPPSEERRRDLAKGARARGEEAKISMRNVRRHARDEVKKTQQELKLSEDMRYAAEEEIDKLTNDYIAKIDHLLDRKEAEIMEV